MQVALYIAFILFGALIAVVTLIGLLDVVRGTPINTVGGEREGDCCPPVTDPFFRESFELLTHVTLRPGHEVEFYINGDQTYPPLWEDLRNAKLSITLQMYYCNAGKMADTLHGILCDRARAGVEVFFLFDSFGTTLPEEYFETLRAAGVMTTSFRPFSIKSLQKLQHRAHIRVIVVDGKIGYTGGFGIDDKWYGDGRHQDQWRDTNVRFTGHAVRQLQATFVVCWAEASGELLTSVKLLPLDERSVEEQDRGVIAGLLHASPTIGSTAAERFFALSIASARKKLYISNSYFVPTKAFRKLMCDAAGRGVDVRVLTVSKNTDVKSTWYAGRARYEELMKGGVRIFEYQPAMMHAKTIVVDGGWLSVGSMNADNRSMSFNEESNLVVLDDGAGRYVENLFIDDLKYSEEIELESFSRRGIAQKTAELACHLIWRVL